MQNNNAPKTEWRSHVMACGTKRQRLYIDGRETPFFVDTAAVAAHRTYGDVHGLWGAGMGRLIETKTPYRVAACFGSGKRIESLKARAERMATSD